jgi:hypothetical protein
MEYAPSATVKPRWDRPGSMPHHDGFGSDRNNDPTRTAIPVKDSARASELADFRGVVLVLFFSLLAFGWLVLTRNVRVGLLGSLNAPRPEASATAPASADHLVR